jgi:hypothetical protein
LIFSKGGPSGVVDLDPQAPSRVYAPLLRVDDLHSASAFAFGNWPACDDVFEFDAVVFVPDFTKPVPDIAAQNERIVRRVAIRVFVCDEANEGNGREFDLFEGHLVQLGNRDLSGILNFFKIGGVRGFLFLIGECCWGLSKGTESCCL